MSVANYDLMVIGGGPAGEKGAAQAAYFGKRVALIERAPAMGGAVASTAVPFKALRETALYLAGFRTRKLRGVDVQMKERATLRDFLAQEHALVRDYRLKVTANLDNHDVDVVPGQASFVDPHTVKVEHPRRPPILLSADVILIACGSRPYRPPQFDSDGGGIYDANTVLQADCMPKRFAVVGAGPTGCEYACVMALLGCSVTLIHANETFLPFLDSEVATLLQQSLMETGIDLMAGTRVDRVSAGPPFTLALDHGRALETDTILVTAGRIGNTDGLALENAGLAVDARGLLEGVRKACSGGQAAEHMLGRGDFDQRFGGLHLVLVVLAETTVSAQPCEGALDDPGQAGDLEGAFAALDDPQVPAGLLAQEAGKPAARVPGVGNDRVVLGPERSEAVDEALAGAPIRHAGRLDPAGDQQPECVDQDMAFPPLHALVAVEPSAAAALRRLHRLPVHDDDRWAGAYVAHVRVVALTHLLAPAARKEPTRWRWCFSHALSLLGSGGRLVDDQSQTPDARCMGPLGSKPSQSRQETAVLTCNANFTDQDGSTYRADRLRDGGNLHDG
jgi:NADPH-dependent 2,4-dienoyl-CoA reductase/sulfur reductase-like enzyme